ncbi:MAG TPA: RDD family protein [Prolixibacteraceae bacterium]|nr:RDD family protein [Prolixibacteraceae bacterium]
MDIIKIDTSQNIEIEQSIASVGERIAATILDIIFIAIFIATLAIIAGGLHYGWMLYLVYIPVAGYNLLSELFMNGQSWGKKILKIKVVKIDGTPATFSSYFLRWIFRMIEVIGSAGSLAMIVIILNRKGQRLGDMAANTTVIRLRDKSLKETIYTHLPDDYTVMYPEVSRLSVDDIYTIKEVLELLRSPKNKTTQTLSMAQKAREAIEKKLNIKTDQKTGSFFQTIITDYNFINSRN